MKKQLFYSCLLCVCFFTASAQDTCATAVAITTGSYTAGTIDGTYQEGCWGTDGEHAEWYAYTATANGYYRINTNLPENDGITYSDDTRVSIFSGTCAALTCYNGSDDIDEDNYLTDFFFAVAQGQTYYVAFDDNWDATGFLFETTFTPATCFPVTGGLAVVEAGPTEVTISWDPPAIGIPMGYEVEYGEAGFTQGSGTMLETEIAEVTFTDLTENTMYEFYVRTDCGGDDYSDWVGPIEFTTPYAPTDLPYTFGFEADEMGGGWSALTVLEEGSSWDISEEVPDVAEAYSGTQFAYAGAGIGASDTWLFSRGLNLLANEEITVTYYIVMVPLVGEGNINNLEVTIGTDATVEAQTSILATFNNFSSLEYVLQTNTFTAPQDGVYYLGFNYTAPPHPDEDYGIILLDEVGVDSNLGIEDKSLSQLSIYPNPASDYINIANNGGVFLNSIQVTDLNGRIVKSINLDTVSNTQINVSNLSAGMYLLNITSESGTLIQKIIKE